MHVAFGRVRRKSRIIADYTDFADFKRCPHQGFGIMGSVSVFSESRRTRILRGVRLSRKVSQAKRALEERVVCPNTDTTGDESPYYKRPSVNLYRNFTHPGRVSASRQRLTKRVDVSFACHRFLNNTDFLRVMMTCKVNRYQLNVEAISETSFLTKAPVPKRVPIHATLRNEKAYHLFLCCRHQ